MEIHLTYDSIQFHITTLKRTKKIIFLKKGNFLMSNEEQLGQIQQQFIEKASEFLTLFYLFQF